MGSSPKWLDFGPFAGVLVLSCVQEPQVETRTVVVNVPSACITGADPYALFYASGDYPATAGGLSVESLFLDKVATPLVHVPEAARSLLVEVSAAGGTRKWHGLGDVPPSGDVNVLLWPEAAPCELSQPALLAAPRTDAAFGTLDARHVIVVGGRASGAAAPSFIADLATGLVTPLPSELLAPRAQASIAPFGDGHALVAGGARADTGELLASAEVISGAGELDASPILLSEGRTDHGAVALVTGDVLLVGGAGSKGPLGSVELIDSKTRRARTAGVAVLDRPRVHPIVVRLASGEVLVFAGFDALGSPVSLVEWLTPDGRGHSRPSLPLVASKECSVVALEAGGALAVISPDGPAAGFRNVWVISADGALEPARVTLGELEVVRMYPANRGAPILWNGRHWLRWQPWRGEFIILTDTPGTPGPVSASIVSAPDGGLALWFTGTHLRGLRFDARSRYATDSARAPLLVDTPDFFAPDRLVDLSGASTISFDATYGLILARGASAFLTDVTFADFDLDLTVPGEPPLIVLRDEGGRETEIGGPTCPLPARSPAAPEAEKIHIERRAQAVRVRVDAGEPEACTANVAPGGRLQVGIRGGLRGGTVHGLSIDRRDKSAETATN